jgi:hypothetical protein
MSFKKLKEQIEKSEEFKKLKKEYPKSTLYSAFFMLRQAFGNLIIETQQLDYHIEGKKVATLSFDEKENVQRKVDEVEPAKPGEKQEFEKLDDVLIDVDDLQEIIKKELNKNKVGIEEVSKVIVILQKIKGKQVWNITCISGLSLYRIHLDKEGKVLENKKESILSMMKIESGKGKKK